MTTEELVTTTDPKNCGIPEYAEFEVIDAWKGSVLSPQFGGKKNGMIAKVLLPFDTAPSKYTGWLI